LCPGNSVDCPADAFVVKAQGKVCAEIPNQNITYACKLSITCPGDIRECPTEFPSAPVGAKCSLNSIQGTCNGQHICSLLGNTHTTTPSILMFISSFLLLVFCTLW
jgi:hypothetical protein